MKSPAIPKVVKTFSKMNVDDDQKLKDTLVEVFRNGGIELDDDILLKVKDAKKNIDYVATKGVPMLKNGKSVLNNEDYRRGKWLYCGKGYYVRAIDNRFDFAKYAAYNTESRQIIGEWDDKLYTA